MSKQINNIELTSTKYKQYIAMYECFKAYAPTYITSNLDKVQESYIWRIFGGGACFHIAPKGYYMGLVSKAYLEAIKAGTYTKDKNNKQKIPTADHTHPVTTTADWLLRNMDQFKTADEFIAKHIDLSGTIYVMKEENDRLVKFQKSNSGYKTWEEQYKAAGIELVSMSKEKFNKFLKENK